MERTCSTQKQIDSSIMAKVRYDQVDTVRGIAILLVVLGHSIGYITVPLNRLILTFHMPLFFFISGLLAKEDTTQGFLYFLKKKARALLVPQLTLGLLSYSYDVLLKCVLFHKASFGDFNIINSTLGWWFLLVLFYSDMTFYAISRFVSLKIRRNKIIVFFIFLALTLITQFTFNGAPGFPLFINVLPMAFLYYLIGYYLKGIKDMPIRTVGLRGYSFIFVPVLVLISGLNTPVTMYNNVYGNLILFGIGSLSGIYFTWVLGGYLKSSLFLKFMGQNSIIVYVFQFKVIETARKLVSALLPGVYPDCPDYIQYCLIFLLSIIVLIPVTVFCSKYLMFAFGKGRRIYGRGENVSPKVKGVDY